MDSAPPPSLGRRKLRPWYLVATMVTALFIGVFGLVGSCSSARSLREGNVPDVQALQEKVREAGEPDRDDIKAVFEATRIKAMSEIPKVAFPLSVAKILLSLLLVLTCALAVRGGRGGRVAALQVLAANVLLMIVEYALTRPVRAAWVDTMAWAIRLTPQGAPELPFMTYPEFLWWFQRFAAGLEVTALALGLVALTRPRTKSYFDAVARAAESAEEP